MIPIEDHKWRKVDPWLPHVPALPPKHKMEVARIDEDTVVVRVTGPNAHVFGQGPNWETAVTKAVEWFNSVGGEL